MSRTTFSGPVASQNGFISIAATSEKTLTILAPAALSADTTLTFPNGAGSNGQVLTTNGTGTLTWTTNGAGTVTSVATAGTVNGLTLTGGPITSTGTITLGGQFALPTSTAAAVADITNAINTTGKYTGKMVVDYSSGIIYTAVGATAGSDWAPSDASGLVTPV
jgi:hypothetical protein